jgi:hypothetical protein
MLPKQPFILASKGGSTNSEAAMLGEAHKLKVVEQLAAAHPST